MSAHPRDDSSATFETDALRNYYTESEYCLSPEGILKVSSALVCVVSSALLLGAGSCPGAPGLVTSATFVSLLCGVTMSLLYVGALLRLPLRALHTWLYTDIVVSSVIGILLLVIAVLSVSVCALSGAADYAHGPLAMVNAGMLITSAVITYAKVMKRWEAAGRVTAGPARGSMPLEQDA